MPMGRVVRLNQHPRVHACCHTWLPQVFGLRKLSHSCSACPAPLISVDYDCRLLKPHQPAIGPVRVTVVVEVHSPQCTVQTRLLTDDEGAARVTQNTSLTTTQVFADQAITVAVEVHSPQCTVQTRLLTDDGGAARATVRGMFTP